VSPGLVGRDETTAAFFDGTANGQFLIRRCAPFGHASRPQARLCGVCRSPDLRWEPASGRARLVSWAVVAVRRQPDNPPGEPTVVAVAELDEGPWWWSQVVRADPATLAEGQRLRVVYERADGGEAVPVFEPE
jgi:uncharacterized OB-fold protein